MRQELGLQDASECNAYLSWPKSWSHAPEGYAFSDACTGDPTEMKHVIFKGHLVRRSRRVCSAVNTNALCCCSLLRSLLKHLWVWPACLATTCVMSVHGMRRLKTCKHAIKVKGGSCISLARGAKVYSWHGSTEQSWHWLSVFLSLRININQGMCCGECLPNASCVQLSLVSKWAKIKRY